MAIYGKFHQEFRKRRLINEKLTTEDEGRTTTNHKRLPWSDDLSSDVWDLTNFEYKAMVKTHLVKTNKTNFHHKYLMMIQFLPWSIF